MHVRMNMFQSTLKESGGKVGNMDWRLSLDNRQMIRRAMRGVVNMDLEDVNRSSFTHNIRHAKNPLEFKLPTLEIYD